MVYANVVTYMKKDKESDTKELETGRRLVVEVVKDEDNVVDEKTKDEGVEDETSPTGEVVGMSGSSGLDTSGVNDNGKNGSGMLMIAVIALLILSVTGWMMYIRSEWMRRQELLSNQIETEEQVDQEQINEEEVEVVESEQLERGEISLEILNGSGVAGLAAETMVGFEELGYEEISVGNAETAPGNELYVRAGYEDKIDVLMDDVLAELEIATVSGELMGDGEVIARIVLGQ